MRRGLLLGGLFYGLLSGTPAAAWAEADVPTRPDARPAACDPALQDSYPEGIPAWDTESAYETVYDWLGKRSEVPLGVGHIEGADRFWWGGSPVRLPLRSEPGAAAWGWFANGWLIETPSSGAPPQPIGVQGSVETAYEATSFIVLEATPEGWLHIRFGKPDPSAKRDGLAWVHRCHLAREALGFERWEDRFVSGNISPLFFRSDTPHALRERPDQDAPLVRRVLGDHHLEPLAFEGDWMQVRLEQPSDYCAEPGKLEVDTHEGWVRWRSAELGPIVWYHTRGC